MKLRIFLLGLATLLASAGPLHASSFEGVLIRVFSGDTVEIEHDGSYETVRLDQIYAPVQGQPFGVAAKNFIWRVAGNKKVAVRYDRYDLNGHPYGEVLLQDGTNLNKLIVAAGYAWQYEGYSDDPEYAELEAKARKSHLGLWSVDNPIPPWEWRWLQAKSEQVRRSGDQASTGNFVCGTKEYCSEMTSCEEAKFYLYACGLTRLDRDGDGTPCNMKCE